MSNQMHRHPDTTEPSRIHTQPSCTNYASAVVNTTFGNTNSTYANAVTRTDDIETANMNNNYSNIPVAKNIQTR